MLIMAVITILRQLNQLNGSAFFDQLLLLPRMGRRRYTFVWQPIELVSIKITQVVKAQMILCQRSLVFLTLLSRNGNFRERLM